jgi:O-antigen/teichoic acid export membrane protein
VNFLQKGILVSSGQTFGIMLNMIVGILFSRVLGPIGMGQYEIFRSTAVITVTVMALGIGNANIFFLNNRKVLPTIITTNTVKIATVLGGILVAGLMTVILAFPNYFGSISILTALFFTSGVSALLSTLLLRPILVAQLAARKIVSTDLINRVVVLIVGTVLVITNWLSPEAAIFALALGYFSSFLLVMGYLQPYIELTRPFEWRLLRSVITYGMKLASSNLLYVLSCNITVILLRLLSEEGFSDVGLYARAVALCGLVSLLPIQIGPLLYAKWSNIKKEETRIHQAEMTIRVNLAYSLVVCIGVLVLGKYVICIMYGSEFIPATAALQILAPTMLFTPQFGVCNNLFASDGRVGITVWIMIGMVIIIGSVSYLAIPTMGIRGAALGAFCGNAFTAIVSMTVCTRIYGLHLIRCLLLRKSDFSYIRQALIHKKSV